MDSRLIYGCMGLGGSWDMPEYGPEEIDAASAVVATGLSVASNSILDGLAAQATPSAAFVRSVRSERPEGVSAQTEALRDVQRPKTPQRGKTNRTSGERTERRRKRPSCGGRGRC